MLKLIRCEFQKLKRKKFILLVFLAAFMFPVPLSYMVTTPSIASRYADKASLFDGLYNMVLEFGVQFLLPCVIGVIAAMLFFMERDNDTFKNIKNYPCFQYTNDNCKNYYLISFWNYILCRNNSRNNSMRISNL